MTTQSPSNSLDGNGLPSLSAEERVRYSRHLSLPNVGVDGQQRLKAARVLLVGAGGLGSPTALYLAAAGVGTIGLVDQDTVDVTNLQRQLLYDTADVGRPKLDAARARLHGINPHVTVETHAAWLTSANALDILRGYDVVVDGTDNFATRYLVNDACVLLGIPNVHGSIYQFEGQASVFATPAGPCYRCLYPEPPPAGMVPSCAEGGVLGVLPGLIGTMQAIETIKLILGIGDTLAGRPADGRCAHDAVPHRAARARSALSRLWHAHADRAHRLRRVLRHACACRRDAQRRRTRDQYHYTRRSTRAGAMRCSSSMCASRTKPPSPESTVRSSFRSPRSARRCLRWMCRRSTWCSVAAVSVAPRRVKQMQRSGFQRVWSLEGGMLEWEAAR